MSSIEDPLAKPIWPSVDASIQEAALNQLITLTTGGSAERLLVGFNSVMAGLEKHFQGQENVRTIYVARNDISNLESMPLSLASAAGKLRLVTLPKGSKARLNGVSVFCTLEGGDAVALLEQLVHEVGPAEASWTYVSARAGKLPKKKAKKRT